MPKSTRAKSLFEQVDATIVKVKSLTEGGVISAFPDEATIPKLRTNDFKRLASKLSKEEKQRLWKKLTPQQKQSIPANLFV